MWSSERIGTNTIYFCKLTHKLSCHAANSWWGTCTAVNKQTAVLGSNHATFLSLPSSLLPPYLGFNDHQQLLKSLEGSPAVWRKACRINISFRRFQGINSCTTTYWRVSKKLLEHFRGQQDNAIGRNRVESCGGCWFSVRWVGIVQGHMASPTSPCVALLPLVRQGHGKVKLRDFPPCTTTWFACRLAGAGFR